MIREYNFSKKQLNFLIKENTKQKISINKFIVDNYWGDYEKSLIEKITTETEKKIITLIENYVSVPFIAKEFNLSVKQVKLIARKNKCSSYFLINEKEKNDERLFTKLQITKVSEEFNFICPMCFKALNILEKDTITGHHIEPFAKNGATTLKNCLPLHTTCHFENFKLLHKALFDNVNIVYSMEYFNFLKEKLRDLPSGIKEFLH